MKLSLFAFMALLCAGSAFAADAPKPPTCGKTVEDCQKAIDNLAAANTTWYAAYQKAILQRDDFQKQLNDKAVQDYVTQQTAARK